MAECKVKFDGFELGAKSDDVNKLRLLNSGQFTGFGSSVVQVSTERLAGGVALGPARHPARTFEAGMLQASDWGVVRRFVSAMGPRDGLVPLVYEGPAYPVPVCAFVSPQGVASPVDAEGQMLDTIRVQGASWVAPDPTIYTVEQTTFTSGVATGLWNSPSWTNPGVGVVPQGLGGHGWELTVDVQPGSTAINYFRVQIGGIVVYMHGPFVAGDTLTVGPDRLPVRTRSGTSTPIVQRTGSNPTSNPAANWPKFPAGQPEIFRLGKQSGGTYQATLNLRGTWL